MTRRGLFDQLAKESEFDIIVIGGGASGLGAALDAVSRGYKTALFEQHDFAKGTSSRSTKLIHGGVRYLQSGQLKLVKESLKERGRLLRNASHLVKPLAFIVPSKSWIDRMYHLIGLKIYDNLSGKYSLGVSTSLNPKKVNRLLPNLDPGMHRGGILYYDAQFDDARLALAIAEKCIAHGGILLNYCKVTNFDKQGTKISGVHINDMETGDAMLIKGKVVINATGVFNNAIQKMDGDTEAASIIPSQGAHIVLDKKFLNSDTGILIPSTSDGRVLFIIPWLDHVLVGTTETLIDEAQLEPVPFDKEIDFILETLNRYLSNKVARKDILSAFAGLRPLIREPGKPSKDMSRSHKISVSESGLVSLHGGKWTAFRKMGEDVVAKAIKVGGLNPSPSRSSGFRIVEESPIHEEDILAPYGSDAEKIRSMINKNPSLNEKIVEELPYIRAQVIWAVKHEWARTVEDVLARRTRALFINAGASIKAAPAVSQLMASVLSKDQDWMDDQVAKFNELAKAYMI